MLTHNYYVSMENYAKHGHLQTTIDEGDTIVMCNIIFVDGQPVGIVSTGINIATLVQDLTTSLSI